MIGGLRVAVECEECGTDESVYGDECGNYFCPACAFNNPCDELEEAA